MWIIILLALVQITVYFAYFKEGFHSDEIWSYGYANSTHEKNIYENDDGTLSYMNEWTDTSINIDKLVPIDGKAEAAVSANILTKLPIKLPSPSPILPRVTMP